MSALTVDLKLEEPPSETTLYNGFCMFGLALKAYQDTYQSQGFRTMPTRGQVQMLWRDFASGIVIPDDLMVANTAFNNVTKRLTARFMHMNKHETFGNDHFFGFLDVVVELSIVAHWLFGSAICLR